MRPSDENVADKPDFKPAVAPLVVDACKELYASLSHIHELGRAEVQIIYDAAVAAMLTQLHRKLCRTLVVELNGARLQNRLSGDTPEERWNDFISQAGNSTFWVALDETYPTLRTRVDRLIANACDAAMSFASAWGNDRSAVAELLGSSAGNLTSVSFAAGDPHRGGKSVILVRTEGGPVVYKPRSLAPERLLGLLLDAVRLKHGSDFDLTVPSVLDRGRYGWAAFVDHVYAVDRFELQRFYRAMGGWLAISRLLGATDLHAENLIANRAAPVVIDAETLFTPKIVPHQTRLGQASDDAMTLISGTVIATGLLPNRGMGLAWRGVDISAMGALPGEQPMLQVPTLIDAGTDYARIGSALVPADVSQNHPAPRPSLQDHWCEVIEGFDQVTVTLKAMDGAGQLDPLLAPFRNCEIRVVTRATEVYAELGRMLWHPVSLHDEEAAKSRATDLLARMAENISSAPDDPEVIAAEVQDLLIGDVPFFSTIPGNGRLSGPGGTRWLQEADLVDQTLIDWRRADLARERGYIREALANAYARDGASSLRRSRHYPCRTDNLDCRRRAAAERIMAQYIETAIVGRDGTATWIASSLSQTGWALQPLGVELYGGLFGVALVMATYLRESSAKHVASISGLETLFSSVLKSIDLWEDQQFEDRAKGAYVRPPSPGGYLGLGSQIWGRLALGSITGVTDLARAIRVAEGLAEAARADEVLDVLAGRAGAIVPLLALASASGDDAWLTVAQAFGDQLLAKGESNGSGLFWRDPAWPGGLGGFAHGATGVGWALAKLSVATHERRFHDAAERAFEFEDALYDEGEGAWIDLRGLEGTKTSSAWCHGSVGIGLAQLDLDPQLVDPRKRMRVERAVRAARRDALGWGSCACHGDVGAYELLRRAQASGLTEGNLTNEMMLGRLVSSLEDVAARETNGPFQPGLLAGQGGVLYALLEAGASAPLPSILTQSALMA